MGGEKLPLQAGTGREAPEGPVEGKEKNKAMLHWPKHLRATQMGII